MGNLNKLFRNAKKEYNVSASFAHDWAHIQRVLNYCKIIGDEEKADFNVLLPACVLHDLGRIGGSEKTHSRAIGMSKKLLKNASYNSTETNEITNCIKSHSIESLKKPKSVKAMVLFDADKLDSLGVIGLARFFALAGEQNWSLIKTSNVIFNKIIKLSKVGFYTKTGEKMGFEKTKKAFIFYYLLFKELGEKKKTKKLEEILIKNLGKLKGKVLLKLLHKTFE